MSQVSIRTDQTAEAIQYKARNDASFVLILSMSYYQLSKPCHLLMQLKLIYTVKKVHRLHWRKLHVVVIELKLEIPQYHYL